MIAAAAYVAISITTLAVEAGDGSIAEDRTLYDLVTRSRARGAARGQGDRNVFEPPGVSPQREGLAALVPARPQPVAAGAGVRVTRVSDDYREIDVTLRLGVLNRNYFGTQFGGSLFAMTVPFHALMMMHNLDAGYLVWDKAAAIRYLKPGRGDVFARFRLDEEAVVRTRALTDGGEKHEPTFTVHVVDRDGGVVAEVDKTLYIRRSPDAGTGVSGTSSASGSRRAA